MTIEDEVLVALKPWETREGAFSAHDALTDVREFLRTDEPTGRTLLDRWATRSTHPYAHLCPVCSGPISTIGLTKLVYVFEVCSCEAEQDYDHLIERVYHRACLQPQLCTTFEPWGRRRNQPAALDCRRCGRPAEAHQ